MPVLVIGPQRTGTSLVAGVLERLGIDMDVNPISPNGEYYESDVWTNLCREICGDWHCPQIHLVNDATIEKMQKLIESKEGQQWGAKSPYFALIGHIILPLIPEVKVIRLQRDMEITIKSLMRREQGMPEGVARHIQQHAFAAGYLTDRTLQNLKIPIANVPYNLLVDDPERIVNMIAEFALDEKVDTDEAIRFVNPLLRHFEEAV